jgi:hypothetical protein
MLLLYCHASTSLSEHSEATRAVDARAHCEGGWATSSTDSSVQKDIWCRLGGSRDKSVCGDERKEVIDATAHCDGGFEADSTDSSQIQKEISCRLGHSRHRSDCGDERKEAL